MIMTNEEINLAVAAIAGWTEIQIWNASAIKKTYIGINVTNPELGKFIPNYAESLDAIVKVFGWFSFDWNVGADGFAYVEGCESLPKGCDGKFNGDTPAFALCKLLLTINPTPIAPPQVAIIDDDGNIKSPVFEAEFV
jgi:hypothetical protein